MFSTWPNEPNTDMGLFKKKKDQTAQEIIEEMIPEEREAVKELIVRLSNELMELKQQNRMLGKELKEALKRKSAKRDPMLGKVAMVMLSRPIAPDAKIKMFTADNVHTEQAMLNVRRMMRDKDNEFIGAYFLCEMRGKKDAFKRMETNCQAAWNIFSILDRDLKLQEPSESEICAECGGNDELYQSKNEGRHCPTCGGIGRTLIEDKEEQTKS